MVKGILGKKVGMTQIFTEDGSKIPVTVLEVGPCTVQSVKSLDKDGYNAVQLGYNETKESRLKKPQRVYIKSKDLKPMKYVKEIRCDDAPDVAIGDTVDVNMFQVGDYLDISGLSKGKGFQGGMKRCGWGGGRATHGNKSHRRPGSIGASSFPSKVDRGHPGPGQMGNENVTTQNLLIVDIDKENGTIAVKGAVPGSNGSYIMVKFAKKKPIEPRQVVEEPENEGEEKEGNNE